MVRTRCVYTGGTRKNPTYHDLGDHTESLQVDYDPARISYARLLEVFWDSHNPCQQAGSRQYLTAVFFHNEAQKKLALETRDRAAMKRREKVVTAILPVTEVTVAEDYHQKYYLRRQPELIREFQALYPDVKDFLASTAAARVNGYVGGNGTYAELEKQVGTFGLSARAQKVLLELRKNK